MKAGLCLTFGVFIYFVFGTLSVFAQPPDNSSEILARLIQIESKLEKQNSWSNAAFLSPLLIALGGWLAAGYFASSGRKAQDREKMREHLFDSLQWFEGGSQKRSIGVSVVEAHWKSHKEMQPIWRVLLFNQAIHLLSISKERESKTELDNLHRIMKILSDEIKSSEIDEFMILNLVWALLGANTYSLMGEEKKEKNPRGIFIPQEYRESWVGLIEERWFNQSLKELAENTEKLPIEDREKEWKKALLKKGK